MNTKQIICMWCGIGAIILGILILLDASYIDRPGVCGDEFRVIPDQIFLFVLWVFGVTLLTGGLIFTFIDKSKDKHKQ